MELRELKEGKKIRGLTANQTVEIVAVKFHGEEVAEITYKDERGNIESQMIYSDQMAESDLTEVVSTWNFQADSEIFRLASESYRISVPYLFEPYLAVYSSLIEPLPHQISAVYEKMLKMKPLRFVLADDPGAGKTIMTGLLIKELIVCEDVKRCLIVCPGALAEQWQDELRQKFHLNFKIFANDDDLFDINRCIISTDKLARNNDLRNKLRSVDWDLIVCDEAHKMSATVWGNEIKYTKRFQLGKLLGKITRHFLLLTATPHNGKEEDFHLFMSLIDPDRFEGAKRLKNRVDVSDIMRRLVKEDLVTFEGKPLFPERIAYTVNYSLSPQEAELYRRVTDYVAEGFNRAERLTGDKKNSVGFAMTILQRRLASSPKAIYESLKRRTQRLKKILQEKKFMDETNFDVEDWDEYEEFPNEALEFKENEIVDRATASRTLRELRNEIQTLEQLTSTADKVCKSSEDKKWRELSRLLQDNEKISKPDGRLEKLIIFTEHRDTLDYLQQKISSLFGQTEMIAIIHGGLNRKERRIIEEKFKQDKNLLVLIATDAAGEGINLQNAHLMINYDLPWNPNRLEQRFGRIHRIGQKEICHLWNLVANDTREGQVFLRLLKKIEEERAALGGQVFDILGKISFDNKPLRDLLIEAIRYGNDPKVIRRLDNVVDKSFDVNKIQKLLNERALTKDALGLKKVIGISQDMKRGALHRLQPHFIENFFLAAFQKLGGQIYKRGNGRYEITRVPAVIRNKALKSRFADPIAESYERICFAKENCHIAGEVSAIFIAPTNPILDAVSALTLEKFGETLRQGTIFIDDNDNGKNFRLLFCVEVKFQDGRREIIAKRLHFVEISETGQAVLVNCVPYLDYRSPKKSEREKILSAIQNSDWLKGDIENIAVSYAIKNFIPSHLRKVIAEKKIYLDKLERAVRERLISEINYWDNRARELRDKDKNNSERATQRADDLANRLNGRLEEIALQRKISVAAPVVVGGALIVPRGYFDSPAKENFSADAQARSRVEKIAMKAVTKIERELGNSPDDVSKLNCGYDIESAEKNGRLRFIEVKGRNFSADEVTVSKNEILTALNSPENFILAIVTVNDNSAHVVYLKTPFTRPPDFSAVSVNYKISALLRQGKILLDRNISCGGD